MLKARKESALQTAKEADPSSTSPEEKQETSGKSEAIVPLFGMPSKAAKEFRGGSKRTLGSKRRVASSDARAQLKGVDVLKDDEDLTQYLPGGNDQSLHTDPDIWEIRYPRLK